MVTGLENTSFIPKKKIVYDNSRKGTINFAFLIAMILFLVALFSSLSLFLYQNFLNNNIEESSIMLEREKDNFDIGSVKQLSRLSERIKVAEVLLSKHIDLTGLFELLEANTLKTVQFESFDYSLDNDGITISMNGSARSYSTVALQSDIFGEHPLLRDTVFSNLDINEEGRVVFSFSATVDRDLVSYKKRVE